MLIHAKKWRERSLENPVMPDLAMSEAMLRLGKPNEAMLQLRPYLDEKRDKNLLSALAAEPGLRWVGSYHDWIGPTAVFEVVR